MKNHLVSLSVIFLDISTEVEEEEPAGGAPFPSDKCILSKKLCSARDHAISLKCYKMSCVTNECQFNN